MADFTTYTTKEGDRWDLIAYRAYGDTTQMGKLIAANRGIGSPTTLRAGLVLQVPILTGIDLISPDLLPPWKR